MKVMATIGAAGLAVGAYALVAALVRGLYMGLNPKCSTPLACGRNYHDDMCDRVDAFGLTAAAVLWPASLPAIAFYRIVMKPWWENIVKPVAAWSERVFAAKDGEQ